MSARVPERLDPDIRRLLDRAAGGVAPPSDAQSRVSKRLATRLLHEPLGPPRATGASGDAHAAVGETGVRWASLGRTAIAFALGAAVGAAITAGLGARSRGHTSVAAPTVSLATGAPVAAEPPVSEGHAGDPPLPQNSRDAVPTPDESAAVMPPASARKTTEPSIPQASAGTLAREAVLLSAARRALAAAHPDEALARLSAHQRAYPDSVFTEEREALSVNALVQSGRYDEARARAALFERRFPRSMLLSSVRAAVDAIP